MTYVLSTVLATITQHPNSTVIYEGTPVTLSCEATASGPITYQWRRSSGRISNEAIGVTTPTLTIPSVRQDDEDEYYCTASYGVYRNGTSHVAESERAQVVVFGMSNMCNMCACYKYQVELVIQIYYLHTHKCFSFSRIKTHGTTKLANKSHHESY